MKQLIICIAALLPLAFFAPDAKADVDVQGTEMKIPAREREVRVIHFHAPGEAPRPTALMLHGAGGISGKRIADYNHYAATLASAGIDAYIVYYYSRADEEGRNGEFEDRYESWARLIDDVADNILRQKQSNGKIALVGFSNGGILAAGAVVLDPKISAAVVYYGTEPWPLKNVVRHYPPLLILHGTADQIIPVEAGEELARDAKAQGGRVELVTYPGEAHGFGTNMNNKNGVDGLSRTVKFLKEELLGAAKAP